MPPTRREFITSTGALGVSGIIGLPGCNSSGPDNRGPAVDIDQPDNGGEEITVDWDNRGSWDFPVVESLMPFGHGVKSGDPLFDRVVLWTRISIPDPGGWLIQNPQGITEVPVKWVVATDKALSNIVASGDTTTNQTADWTVKIDVDQLQPSTTYWYAFAALGFTSIVGRTKTAPHPDDDITEARILQTSCSKWWGGYFSMYGHIADHNDVDVLLHCGDHIYNKQSPNRGALRMPDGVDEDYDHIDVRDWARPEEVGRRYAFYATDPDLIRAHAAVPFVIMPDQHDTQEKDDRGIYGGDGVSHTDGAEQFHLWNADRPLAADGSGNFAAEPRINLNLNPVSGEQARLFYKRLPWGKLADIITIDMRRNQEDDKNADFLSAAHWAFLENSIADSATRGAKWRIIVNGVCLTQLRTSVNLDILPEPLRGTVFSFAEDTTGLPDYYPGWSEDDASRQRFYSLLRNHSSDNLVVSGDIHGEFVSELIENPDDPSYIPGITPPLGVEIMTGMSSSGLDEDLAAQAYTNANGGNKPGMDPSFTEVYIPGAQGPADVLETAIRSSNPNLMYIEWSDDAYALLDLRSNQATTELWRVNKRQQNAPQDLMYQMTVAPGAMNVRQVALPSATAGSNAVEAVDNPPSKAEDSAFEA